MDTKIYITDENYINNFSTKVKMALSDYRKLDKIKILSQLCNRRGFCPFDFFLVIFIIYKYINNIITIYYYIEEERCMNNMENHVALIPHKCKHCGKTYVFENGGIVIVYNKILRRSFKFFFCKKCKRIKYNGGNNNEQEKNKYEII